VIKSRNMIRAKHVVSKRKMRNASESLHGEPERMDHFGEPGGG
jgi:hypothetical protein